MFKQFNPFFSPGEVPPAYSDPPAYSERDPQEDIEYYLIADDYIGNTSPDDWEKENEHEVILKFTDREIAVKQLRDSIYYDESMHEGYSENDAGTNYYLVDSKTMGKKYNIGDQLDKKHQE